MKHVSYKKGIANTYHAKRQYDNNLFPKKKMPKKLILLASFLILAAAGWGVHSFLRLPFMQIQAVRIHGLETIEPHPVEMELYTKLQESTLLGVSRLNLLRRQKSFLLDLLPLDLFASIDVSRSGKVIDIFVEEQAQGSLVHANNTWSLHSLTGEYIRELSEEEVSFVSARINLQKVEQYLFYRDTPIVELANQNWGTEFIQAPLVQVKEMHDQLLVHGHQAAIHLLHDENFLWAEAVMSEGYRLHYDLERGIDAQIEQLETVLRETNLEAATPQVIDVRFNGRVFVQ